jgi:hypothetical protein
MNTLNRQQLACFTLALFIIAGGSACESGDKRIGALDGDEVTETDDGGLGTGDGDGNGGDGDGDGYGDGSVNGDGDAATCRDGIECLVMCQFELIVNMDPEPDLSCFLECDESLPTEEAYKLIQLAECINLQCEAEGACGGEATDMECLVCLTANSQDPEPEGCEEQAANCE